MKTRKQYMNHECTFHEYYSQFVNDWQLSQVENKIGLDKLLNSKDEHLNDIPLKLWDNIGVCGVSVNLMKECGDGYTLAGAVCINKTAARMIIEKHTKE